MNETESQPTMQSPLIVDSIVDPITGELVNVTDVDQLVESYQRISEVDSRLYKAKCAIRAALGKLTTGKSKTRRVRGALHRVIVEMPDANWDNSILKEAWASYPGFAQKFLKIGRIDVKIREFKKLANEFGKPAFESFKAMLLAAQKPPTGLPRIIIEEAPHKLDDRAIVESMQDDYESRHGSGIESTSDGESPEELF